MGRSRASRIGRLNRRSHGANNPGQPVDEALRRRVTALDALDLEIEAGEVFGYLGPNGAGKSTTIALLLGLIRPTSGAAQIFGLDVRRDAPAIHRRLAYVPSEANLWPSLTGAEALQLPGRDPRLGRRGLPRRAGRRFELTPDKKIRAYSHGNRQKVLLIAALRQPRRPAAARRADDRARPAHGAGVPDVRAARPATAARPCCCRRTS